MDRAKFPRGILSPGIPKHERSPSAWECWTYFRRWRNDLPTDYFGGSNFEIEAKLGGVGKQADKRGKTDQARGARWLAGLGGRVNSNSIHGGLASLTRGHQRLRCGNRRFGPGLEKRRREPEKGEGRKRLNIFRGHESSIEFVARNVIWHTSILISNQLSSELVRFLVKNPLHLNGLTLLREYI